MPVQEQARRINELDLVERLTEREHEVMLLLVNGRTNREIADELFVVERTVKYHASNIYAKTGVSSRTELASLILGRPEAPSGP
ncbi:MAG: helix-turn-helix transcriptional regulator [Eggerthellaceae bacterium]|nr:helix-turn-helix transcriptional regulator [Eggerthellaceae bacterium]MDR2716173.1 helix-turn-helix transcriptional regulator [Coriobacteriaceae bacterium]